MVEMWPENFGPSGSGRLGDGEALRTEGDETAFNIGDGEGLGDGAVEDVGDCWTWGLRLLSTRASEQALSVESKRSSAGPTRRMRSRTT